MSKPIRTRFAPSPTGFQHVGGMRTAFFAWLLARHSGGKFILRIEDTDQERKVDGAIKFLFEEFKWFGIDLDECPSQAELDKYGEPVAEAPTSSGPFAPYIQSLRRARYTECADLLVEKGVAYRCDCTPQMLDKERLEQMARKELPGYSGYCRDRNVPKSSKHVVRFRIPVQQPQLVLEDAIKGRVTWDSISLRDTVLLKTDGFPTYHLACMVDDHDMQVSHVIRGDEWLPSAPIHLMLYEAFGWEKPIFAHFPVINGTDGKKLSKRRNAPSTDKLREEGYLPEAVLNYVSLIGWSVGEGSDQELFSKEELIKVFSLAGVHKSSGIYDPKKLEWMNGVYIRKLSADEFVDRCKPFLKRAGIEIEDPENLRRFRLLAPHVQERVRILSEVGPMVDFLFVKQIQRELQEMLHKEIDKAKAQEILKLSSEGLKNAATFDRTSIEGVLRPLAEKLGLKPGPMFGVLRIAVTGKKITPPLFESFEALGKQLTLERIEETIPLLG